MLKSKKFHVILSILFFIILWKMFSYILTPSILPPPLEIGATFWEMVKSGAIWVHIWVSLQRILIGYIWGILVGVPVGLFMGRILPFRYAMDPLINFLRSIPPVAIIPLAIVWFGIGNTAKYFIVFYASVVVIILNTMSGTLSTSLIRIRAAQCLGANNLKIFTTVIFPSAWPYILTGMRSALGLSFMGVVVAEMISADAGIGFLIMQGRMSIMVNIMYVGMITLGIMGSLSDQFFKYLTHKMMRRYMIEMEK